MTAMVQLHNAGVNQRLEATDVAFTVGQHYHILGPNGAGKSTLLQVLSGALPLTHGQCSVKGKDISRYGLSELARWRCFFHSEPMHSFELQVQELWRFYIPYFSQVPAALETAFEVQALQSRRLLSLSQGENQRVQLARVLMQIWPAVERGEALILLDEPLATLDIRHQLLCLQLLGRLAQQGNTVIITSHDVNLSAQHAQQLLFLKQGRVLSLGTPADILTQTLLTNLYDCTVTLRADNQPRLAFALFSS